MRGFQALPAAGAIRVLMRSVKEVASSALAVTMYRKEERIGQLGTGEEQYKYVLERECGGRAKELLEEEEE
jgi:hypothetical protein